MKARSIRPPTALYVGQLNRRLRMDERVQDALARDRTIDITTRGRKTGELHRTRSGSTQSMDTCTSRGVQAAVTGMPTCWRTPSLPSISSRAQKPTCPPGPHPSWIGKTPCDHRQHSSKAWRLSRSGRMGRGRSTGRRGIPRRVSWRLVSDGVEAHVGMLDPEIVSTEPILLADDDRVRDAQCV